jgi:hypothetical protein
MKTKLLLLTAMRVSEANGLFMRDSAESGSHLGCVEQHEQAVRLRHAHRRGAIRA